VTQEQRKYQDTKLSLEETDREVFRRTFGTEDGVQVLTWILNECGRWSCDPVKVVPELQALSNRLLSKLGIVHELNLFEVTRKYLDAANDEDLAALRVALRQEEVED